jgi:hypothetical protein
VGGRGVDERRGEEGLGGASVTGVRAGKMECHGQGFGVGSSAGGRVRWGEGLRGVSCTWAVEFAERSRSRRLRPDLS